MKNLVLVFCGLLFCGPASAAVIPLTGAAPNFSSHAGQLLVQRHAEALGAPGATVRYLRADTVPGGHAYRYRQVHAGLPVLNGAATVLVLNGRLVALTGDLWSVRSLPVPDRRLTPAAASRALVRAMPGARVRHASRAIWSGQGILGAGNAREVWVMDVITASPFGLWEIYLDAGSGKILSGRSAMQHADGQVYSTNPVVGKLVTKSLVRLDKKDALTGTYARVQRCNLKDQTTVTCDNLAKADAKGDFVYAPKEPSISDEFAEVQGYYHVDAFHNYLSSNFGFKRPGSTQQIGVVVNFHLIYGSSGQKQGYPNAFFGDIDGDKKGDLVFGQASRDFVYDADVVYHEFTHSAVDATSDLSMSMDSLGANVTPMALNEGFADLFSSAFTNDGVVGDYSKPGGIRQLTGAASCPGGLSGQSHEDGLIWSRSVWAVRSKLNDTKTFDQILYTVMSTLNGAAGFADADKLFRQVAKVKDATLEAAAAAEFKSRGLTTCSRFIPLTENLTRQGYIYGVGMTPGMAIFPFGYQYELKVPKDAEELTLFVKGYGWGGNGSIAAYVRSGDPVKYSYSGSTYDLIKSNTTDTLVIDKNSKAPLVPGSTYYVLPLNAGKQTTVFNISYSVKLKAPPLPDMPMTPDMGATPDQTPPGLDSPVAYVDGADNESGLTDRTGCSCSLEGDGTAPLLPLLMVLGLWVVFRRRAGV